MAARRAIEVLVCTRKTAARKREGSGTLYLHRREPGLCGGFHHLRRDSAHAAMVGWAVAEKTRAAIRFLLNDRAAWSHGGCAVGIRGTKHGNHRQAYTGRDVHRPGIVANEKMAVTEQSGEISDRSFLCEIDGGAVQFGSDCACDGRLSSRSEKNNISVTLRLQPVHELGKARRRPAFCGAVGGACANRNPQ